MANYILRDVPQDVWDRFKARQQADQWHLRRLLLQLMDDYGRGRVSPSTGPEPTPTTGFINVTCPAGHEFQARFEKNALRERGVPRQVFCIQCGTSTALAAETRDNLESWTHTADAPDL